MAYPANVQEAYQAELQSIRDKGIYKVERYIHSPQASGIEVEFPAGAPLKRVVNLCANNYLGLSSHPEVVAAAHRGLDERGYGMSSVRFICGTQDIHRELENKLTEFLGTEDTILFPSCMDANGGVFEAVLSDQDVMIADRLVHASIVDGMRLCKAMQDTYKHADMKHLEQKLQEHQDKRGPADHHRRRVQHGRRPRAARRDRRARREVRRDGVRGRQPRQRLHGEDRARHARALRRRRQDRHHHDDARQGARGGERRLRVGPQGGGRAVPPEGAAVPVQQRRAAADRLRGDQGARDPEREHRAARPARGEPRSSGARR